MARSDRATVEDTSHVGGCGGALLKAELAEHCRHVGLHRLLGNEQPLADLPVGQAFPDEHQDIALVRGQTGQRVGLAGHIQQPGHQPARRAEMQQRSAGGGRTDRADQIGAVSLLKHVPGRSGHDRVQQRSVVAERSEHQAGHLGQPRPDLPADRHPIPIGQPDIEHGHIGAQRRNPGQRGGCRASLADHPDVRLGLQQAAHPPADDLVVV